MRVQALAFALQVGFKRELIKEVKLFVGDAQAFRQDWEANGPMAPGLDPMDAVDRLKKFQQMFEVSFAAPSGPVAAAALGCHAPRVSADVPAYFHILKHCMLPRRG